MRGKYYINAPLPLAAAGILASLLIQGKYDQAPLQLLPVATLLLVNFYLYKKNRQKEADYRWLIFLSILLALSLTGTIQNYPKTNIIDANKLLAPLALIGILQTRTFKKISKKISKKLTKSKSKEKKILTIAILLIASIALMLRVAQLDFLPPAGDEFRHLIAAKNLLLNSQFDYPNSISTTHLTHLSFSLFSSNNLFAARMPFVILGTLSTILILFLGKRLANVHVGIIASLLYATMPLAIGMARYIRGYEVINFLIIALTLIAASIKEKYSFIALPLLLGTLLIFKKIDNEPRVNSAILLLGTFVTIKITLTAIKKLRTPKNTLSNKLIITTIASSIILTVINFATEYQYSQSIDTGYLFLVNYQKTSLAWYPKWIPTILPTTILILSVFAKKRQNFIIAILGSTLLVLYFFTNLFEASRSFQPRYIYFLAPYLCILLALGAFNIIKITQNTKIKLQKTTIIATATLLVIIFNPASSITAIVNEEPGEFDRKTNLAYYDSNELVKYLKNNKINPVNTLTNAPWVFDYYFDFPFLTNKEKDKYVNFPKNQYYERYDRTKIYSIDKIGRKESKSLTHHLVKNNEIDHIILQGLPEHENPIYRESYTENNFPNIELIKTIDPDKTFAYYIYRVNQ